MEATFVLDASSVLLLFAVGACAGFIDAIAGGGGLLSVPALLASGMNPAQALATNKLQSSIGAITAAWNFYRRGHIDLRLARASILFTALGAAGGALTVQQVDPAFLKAVIPWLLVAIASYVLMSPKLGDDDAHARLGPLSFAAGVGLSLGFYDGFFGPGVGSFLVFAHVLLLGYNLLRASAHAKVMNCTSNLVSLAVFIIGGQVIWLVGLVMALGQLLGAWAGSSLVIAKGARIVRPLLVISSLAMTIRLVAQDPANPLHQAIVQGLHYLGWLS